MAGQRSSGNHPPDGLQGSVNLPVGSRSCIQATIHTGLFVRLLYSLGPPAQYLGSVRARVPQAIVDGSQVAELAMQKGYNSA